MHTPKDLIVFGCCGDIGSGKSTVAKLFSPWNFRIVNFADKIKEVAIKDFGWDGVKDSKGRLLLQHVGKLARAYNPNIWIEHVKERLNTEYSCGARRFILPDCRMESEIMWLVRVLNGTLVWVRRDTAEEKATDPDITEQEWKKLVTDKLVPVKEINNNGTLPETFEEVYRVLIENKISIS